MLFGEPEYSEACFGVLYFLGKDELLLGS